MEICVNNIKVADCGISDFKTDPSAPRGHIGMHNENKENSIRLLDRLKFHLREKKNFEIFNTKKTS